MLLKLDNNLEYQQTIYMMGVVGLAQMQLCNLFIQYLITLESEIGDLQPIDFLPAQHHPAKWNRIECFRDDADCINSTRFTKAQLYQLIDLFGLDELIRVPCGRFSYCFHREEMICYMLIKMRSGSTHAFMDDKLTGGDQTRWTYGYRWIVNYLANNFRHVYSIEGLRQVANFIPRCAEALREVLAQPRSITNPFDPTLGNIYYPGRRFNAANDPLANIFGFFYCKEFQIARPGTGPNITNGDNRNRNNNWYLLQRAVYSGNKKKHTLKVFTVMLPNGLNYVSPIASGRRNDNYVATSCEVDEILVELNQNNLQVHDNDRYYSIYGDNGFGSNYFCLKRARKATVNNPLTVAEKVDLHLMKGWRVAIEHSYGKSKVLWEIELMGPKVFQLLNNPQHVYDQLHVMIFLTNIHTCLNGSVCATELNMIPPSVENYLNGSLEN